MILLALKQKTLFFSKPPIVIITPNHLKPSVWWWWQTLKPRSESCQGLVRVGGRFGAVVGVIKPILGLQTKVDLFG